MTTIYLLLDTRRANICGKYPIKMRLCHNRQSTCRNTGFDCKIDEWDNHKQRLLPNAHNSTFINGQLQTLVMMIERYIKANQHTFAFASMSPGEIMSAALTEKEDYFTQSKDENLFWMVYHQYTNSIIKERTKETYSYTEKKIKSYLLQCNKTIQNIDEVNYAFLRDFDSWLNASQLSINSKSIIFRNLRTIWNYAIDCDFASVTNYPFRKFKIKHTLKEKEYLPFDGIRKLLSMDLQSLNQGSDTLEMARDFFMLSFFLCGINPIDLFVLPQQHSNKIYYSRSKVEHHNPTTIKITIQPEAQQIIDKYSGTSTMLNFGEHYSNYRSFYNHIRHRIDRLAIMIGYPQLTLYWARYSWATYAASLDVPINVIGKALGHADATLAEERYISFDWNKVDIANRRVIDYVMEGVVPNSIPAPKYVEKVSKK